MHVRNARLVGKCGCDQSSKDQSDQNFSSHQSPPYACGRQIFTRRCELNQAQSFAWREANYDAWQRIHANFFERLTPPQTLDSDHKLSTLNK
jgi:hypothetical protein